MLSDNNFLLLTEFRNQGIINDFKENLIDKTTAKHLWRPLFYTYSRKRHQNDV